MENHLENQSGQRRKRSKGLLIATSAFGLLYLWFIVVSFIPAPQGNWISTTVPFDPWDREQIFVKLMFVFFLPGYFVAWKSERIAGVIFVLWWIAMWGVDLFVWAPIKPEAAGMGIAMGFPLFVLGILFVRRWYKGRSVQTVHPAP